MLMSRKQQKSDQLEKLSSVHTTVLWLKERLTV